MIIFTIMIMIITLWRCNSNDETKKSIVCVCFTHVSLSIEKCRIERVGEK